MQTGAPIARCVRVWRMLRYAFTALILLSLASLPERSAAAAPVLAFPDGVYVQAKTLPALANESGEFRFGETPLVWPAGAQTHAIAEGPCTVDMRLHDEVLYVAAAAARCLGWSVPPGTPQVVIQDGLPLLDLIAPPSEDSLRVIIDAGHGGADGGARGHGGLEEKTVTLSVAKMLHAHLATMPGFDVYLTRTDDSYLTLRERAERANRMQADLFISIHANAGHRASAAGIEIFIASRQADDKAALRLAALENIDSTELILPMDQTQSLLADLALSDQLQHSAHAASVMLAAMTDELGAENRGVKRAPFWVLLGSNMPAVLIETGFITNENESLLLSDDGYQNRMAHAMARALTQLKPTLLTRRVRNYHAPIAPSTPHLPNAPQKQPASSTQAHSELAPQR
jgi:N-acetylmuramoyl-L-alanine amidase